MRRARLYRLGINAVALLTLGLMLQVSSACVADPLTVGGVTEFTQGINSHLGGLVLTPDGNFWYDAQFEDKVGFFDVTTKSATEYSVPPGTQPHNLILGPDGNLWWAGLLDNIGTFNL